MQEMLFCMLYILAAAVQHVGHARTTQRCVRRTCKCRDAPEIHRYLGEMSQKPTCNARLTCKSTHAMGYFMSKRYWHTCGVLLGVAR